MCVSVCACMHMFVCYVYVFWWCLFTYVYYSFFLKIINYDKSPLYFLITIYSIVNTKISVWFWMKEWINPFFHEWIFFLYSVTSHFLYQPLSYNIWLYFLSRKSKVYTRLFRLLFFPSSSSTISLSMLSKILVCIVSHNTNRKCNADFYKIYPNIHKGDTKFLKVRKWWNQLLWSKPIFLQKFHSISKSCVCMFTYIPLKYGAGKWSNFVVYS